MHIELGEVLEASNLLEVKLSNGFQKDLLTEALDALEQVDDPYRLKKFGEIFRQLANAVIEYLAPASEIRSSAWFKKKSPSSDVSDSARASFLAHGGMKLEQAEDLLNYGFEEAVQQLNGAFVALRHFMQFSEDVPTLDAIASDQYTTDALGALAKLILEADDAKSHLLMAFDNELSEVMRELTNDALLEDEGFAKHRLSVSEFEPYNADVIHVAGTGTRLIGHSKIRVNLRSRYIGKESGRETSARSIDVPVTLRFQSPANNILALKVVKGSLSIGCNSADLI